MGLGGERGDLAMSEACVRVDNIAISDISYDDITEEFTCLPEGLFDRRGYGVGK